MKERLVEDWLIRIHERGYGIPFCQILASRGYKILRYGHSPTEHGKDVIAISPDGSEVHAYQLKSGDVSQADIQKHHSQLSMLVETLPIHPGLPKHYTYHPYFVTTGDFKEPAISLIRELNESWKRRDLPEVRTIGGRQLLADFLNLSGDFWPIEAPDVRKFRKLYLVDGRGDFDPVDFSQFILTILQGCKSALDCGRRAAAANIFSSYLLAPFSEQADHWSVFSGWIICASHIAWLGESGNYPEDAWKSAFALSRSAARESLKNLRIEALKEDALDVMDRELDEYTCVRNTTTLAAIATSVLVDLAEGDLADISKEASLALEMLKESRLIFWGQGAFSQFVSIIHLLEVLNFTPEANQLLIDIIALTASTNGPESGSPLPDPYTSIDEILKDFFARTLETPERQQRRTTESYIILPLVLFAVRRNLRPQLSALWPNIGKVRFTFFKAERPSDLLLWHSPEGQEQDHPFQAPQSWKELQDVANQDPRERLPTTLTSDLAFSLMFALAYPHRTAASLTLHIDLGVKTTLETLQP